MRQPLNVRLCKGAYHEPESIAYATKGAVDGSFKMLAQKLLDGIPRGVYPAFATHDRALIESTRAREMRLVDGKLVELRASAGMAL